MLEAQAHEEALVTSFVIKSRHHRLLYVLKNRKRRREALKFLAHFDGLDPRWAHRIPAANQTAELIAQILRRKGAPEICYAISQDPEIDGRFINISEVLDIIVGYGVGTLLSCIPGRLGYFEGEAAGERFVLEKSLPPQS
jgi:hypothetical protein